MYDEHEKVTQKIKQLKESGIVAESAGLLYEVFENLINAGFTREEAIQIVCSGHYNIDLQ